MPAPELEDLAGSELVVEASPEELELKRGLFARLERVCGEHAALATNTSSLSVSAIAAPAEHPERVCGMHFFNPPALMALLEVIPAAQTGERALAMARAAGEAMGKHVIVVADGPGFLVNRCARPYTAEALRLLQERVASPEASTASAGSREGFPWGRSS